MSKYSPEIAKEIIQLIKAGNYAKIAYGAVGISHELLVNGKRQRAILQVLQVYKKSKSRN